MTQPSRTPEARRANYMRNRTPRPCGQCGEDLELGSKKRLCDTCRATPNPRCKKCKKVKPLSSFSHDKTRPSGYFPWCMACQGEGVKAGGFQNPDDAPNGRICPMDDVIIRGHANRKFCSNGCKGRASALKAKYNLTPRQYRDMVEVNGELCPICQKKPTQWHVDHDHSDGRVMGPVCSACNIGALAYTNHDPEMVKRLLDFLENPPALRAGVVAFAPEGTERPSNLHKKWNYKRR